MPQMNPEKMFLPRPLKEIAGLIGGILLLAMTFIFLPPAGLPDAGWKTLGLALLMAVWWTTEPIPIGATALLPVIAFPLLGIVDLTAAAAPYANPLVFLFLGGFLLAAGVSRWGLHRRIAVGLVRLLGTEPRRLVLGFMVATAFLSMWISNTAAVLLMLPVATSIVVMVQETRGNDTQARRFSLALLLGLAYAASIGGMGTLIGTPPNALLAAHLSTRHGIDLSFAGWAAIAMPVVIIFLPVAWLILTRLVYPVSSNLMSVLGHTLDPVEIFPQLKPATAAEKRVAVVFCAAALLWITRPLLNHLPGLHDLSDTAIALICGAGLFLVPSGDRGGQVFLLSWREAQDLPWQVLLLFGGGLSLAAAMDASGLAAWIGSQISGLSHLPQILILVVIVAVVVLLTELTSNTATVAALLPVLYPVALLAGLDVVAVSAAVAMAASCAFMLPVATPPNALIFGSGYVTVFDMARAGVAMNLLSIILISAAAALLIPFLAPILFH